MHLPIRLIPHGKVKPCLLIHNTLIMRKGIKSGFSVISAHAAFTKSAEAHFRSSQMNDCVVDTAAAETAAGSNFFCRRFVGSKKVIAPVPAHPSEPERDRGDLPLYPHNAPAWEYRFPESRECDLQCQIASSYL